MSVLDKVLASLETMTQWQLLLAFIGCIAYAFAQGSLLLPRGRRVAWIIAAAAALGFVVTSSEWTFATMLLGFAVAALGTFVAVVWLTCRAIGFGKSSGGPEVEWPSTSPAALASAQPRRSRHGEPAHSHFSHL